jgi:predicted RNase H-like HicB family nuclease
VGIQDWICGLCRRGILHITMTVAYAVVVEHEEDGRYSVYVPDLPGCASMGDTYEEAISNVREAVACHLEGLRIDGLPVPPPRAHFTMVDVEAA